MASQAAVQTKPIHERGFCYGERVMVEVLKEPEQEVTQGGIHRPEVARKKPNRARVVALGEGRMIEGRWMPLNLHVGQIVEFSRSAVGIEKDMDGQDYLLLHWKQIDWVERD